MIWVNCYYFFSLKFVLLNLRSVSLWRNLPVRVEFIEVWNILRDPRAVKKSFYMTFYEAKKFDWCLNVHNVTGLTRFIVLISWTTLSSRTGKPPVDSKWIITLQLPPLSTIYKPDTIYSSFCSPFDFPQASMRFVHVAAFGRLRLLLSLRLCWLQSFFD